MIQCLHTETDCLHADLEVAEVRIFPSLPWAAHWIMKDGCCTQPANPRTWGHSCISFKSFSSVP